MPAGKGIWGNNSRRFSNQTGHQWCLSSSPRQLQLSLLLFLLSTWPHYPLPIPFSCTFPGKWDPAELVHHAGSCVSSMSSRPTDFGYPSSSMTDSLPNETTPLLVQGSNSTPVSILVKDGLPITRPSSPLSLKQWSRGKSRLFKHRKAKLYKTSSSSTNFQVERDPTASHRNLASDSEDFHDPTQSSIISSATDVHSELGQSCSEVQCRSQSEMALSSPICSSESVLRFHLREGVSLRLQNSGSVARDHLASERTFLAYMRTSLAIASSGVAIVQLFSAASASAHHGSVHRLQVYIRPLGASTIIVGLFVLFIGITRYFTVQAALTKGYFPVARVATGLIAIMLTVLVTLTFGIMLAGKLEPRLGGT